MNFQGTSFGKDYFLVGGHSGLYLRDQDPDWSKTKPPLTNWQEPTPKK